MDAQTKMRPRGPSLPQGAFALGQEVRDLLEEIAHYLDDDQIERFPDYFTEDCLYKVVSRENHAEGLPQAAIYCDGIGMVHDRITGLRETQVYVPRMWRHFISGVRITAIDDDAISSSANFLVTEAMSDAEPTVLLVGQYQSQCVRVDGSLKLRQHLAIYDNYRIVRSLVVPV